jgi:hypothetical protein
MKLQNTTKLRTDPFKEPTPLRKKQIQTLPKDPMKRITFTRKAKISYTVSIALFFCAILFLVCGILSIGCILSGVAFGIAFRVAKTNGHMQ